MPALPTRILLVDDDPALQRVLRHWLEGAGYTVTVTGDGSHAKRLIEDRAPQLLITDWEMPACDGLELCNWLRQQDFPNYIYTIFLTSRTSSEDMITALEAGADDFMRKPVDKGELLARVRAGLRVLELESRLSILARTDPLTGLATRRTFVELVEREWGRSQRHLFPISCVMIDIDFFKRINDTYGHRAGDQALRGIARILRQNCRSSDIVGRYGGEEFCVLLPEANEEAAVMWAERVRRTIAGSSTLVDDLQIQVTASFGIAQRLADTNSPEQLVDLADQALLVAKRSGRDRVVGFQSICSSESIRAARGSIVSAFHGLVAKDVMATIVATLRDEDTVVSAIRYFLRFRFHSGPVVNEDGALVGVLSERDLMGTMLWPNWWRTKIKSVMRQNVVCYDENTPVLTIFEFLCRVSIRGVVIVRNGRPTGMISRASLLRWFTNLLAVNPGALLDAEAETDEQQGTLPILPAEPRGKIAALAEAIAHDSAVLAQQLKSDPSDLIPVIVGGVSRVEEMLNDLLSFSRSVSMSAANVQNSRAKGMTDFLAETQDEGGEQPFGGLMSAAEP